MRSFDVRTPNNFLKIIKSQRKIQYLITSDESIECYKLILNFKLNLLLDFQFVHLFQLKKYIFQIKLIILFISFCMLKTVYNFYSLKKKKNCRA